MSAKIKGKVKWYNRQRGFGVIVAEDGQSFFLHHSFLPSELSQKIEEGTRLLFDIIPRPYNKGGYEAINVEIDHSPEPKREPSFMTKSAAPSTTKKSFITDYWFEAYASAKARETSSTEDDSHPNFRMSFQQKNAIRNAQIAARAGMPNLARHFINKAFKSDEARNKHIASLPEAEEGFRAVVIMSEAGVSLAEEWPKGQHVRPSSGLQWALAWAAAKLGGGDIEVEETADGKEVVKFTGKDTDNQRVLSWKRLDARKGLVKRVKLNSRGIPTAELFRNAGVSAKIGAAALIGIDGHVYGAYVRAGERLANWIDSLYAPDGKALKNADGDKKKVKAQMRLYRIEFADGTIRKRHLTPADAEKVARFAVVEEVAA